MCAENTLSIPQVDSRLRNYLRVRGEYITIKVRVLDWKELPPCARRIQPPHLIGGGIFGTTSVCAENTGEKVV